MSCGLRAPDSAEDFTLRTVTTAEVPCWYHVYSTAVYPSTALTFAEGWGDTRFAPIEQDDGTPVHTYYAASTRESVYMESVLHNVALAPPGPLSSPDKSSAASTSRILPACWKLR